MTALVAERDTQRRNGDQCAYPVAAATKIWAGSIVCMSTAAPYATKGITATTLRAVGLAEETADNTTGAAGAILVKVRHTGWYRFTNFATDLIALIDVGADCYIVDDQTVGKTNGGATRSIAGVVRDVDAAGVWIEFLK